MAKRTTRNTPATPQPALSGGVLVGYTPAAIAAPTPAVCPRCGKSTPKTGGMGHTCALNATRPAAHRITVAAPPQGWLKVAAVHVWLVRNKQHGCSVSRFVKSFGGDGGFAPPVHPICTPVYVGTVRYVHPWLATPAGATAMATGNFASAPAVTLPK